MNSPTTARSAELPLRYEPQQVAGALSGDLKARSAVTGRLRNWLSGQGTHRAEFLASAWWSLVSAIIARGSNTVLLVICARILAQERFGELAIVQSTVAMFGPLAGLGLGATVTKFLAECRARDPVRAGRILTLSLICAAAAGFLMTGALIVLAPFLAKRSLAAPQLAGTLALSSGLLFLGVFEAVQTGALTGLEAFRRIAALNVWNGLLSLPLTLVLVNRYGVNGAIGGMTASLALACLLNAIALRSECKRLGIPRRLDGCLGEWPILLSFSLPTYMGGIIIAPVSWMASAMLVNQSHGYAEMGVFGAADRFRLLLIFVPLAVSRIALPALSRLRSEGDGAGYHRILRLNVLFGTCVVAVPALLCAAISPWLMSLYGVSFRTGWLTMAILALSAIPTMLNTQLGAVFMSHGHAWTRMIIDFCLAALFLGAAWWAIPRWQSVGLAAAFAFAYSVAALLVFLCIRGERYNVPRQLRPVNS
jgi:O-antigen/teichoic acid export membrane protein